MYSCALLLFKCDRILNITSMAHLKVLWSAFLDEIPVWEAFKGSSFMICHLFDNSWNQHPPILAEPKFLLHKRPACCSSSSISWFGTSWHGGMFPAMLAISAASFSARSLCLCLFFLSCVRWVSYAASELLRLFLRCVLGAGRDKGYAFCKV